MPSGPRVYTTVAALLAAAFVFAPGAARAQIDVSVERSMVKGPVQARVTIFRGLPYDLPLGVRLYTTNYVSGVGAREVPGARREKLLDHTLRSRNDAYDLVRKLEQGQVAR